MHIHSFLEVKLSTKVPECISHNPCSIPGITQDKYPYLARRKKRFTHYGKLRAVNYLTAFWEGWLKEKSRDNMFMNRDEILRVKFKEKDDKPKD